MVNLSEVIIHQIPMRTLANNTSEVGACQTFVHYLGNDEQIVMDLEMLQIFNKGTLMLWHRRKLLRSTEPFHDDYSDNGSVYY